MRPQLIDNLGRRISYLRLAVTDRCNLHCRYCQSATSRLDARRKLLSYEELIRLTRILVAMGISKVRITGGEPFVRNGLLDLLRYLRALPGIQQLALTTNGTLAGPHLDVLRKISLDGLNISLDTLSPQRFLEITGKDHFAKVMAFIHDAPGIIKAGAPIKINTVVQDGVNTDELLELAQLAENLPAQVRFIELMPFNGAQGFEATDWGIDRLRGYFAKNLPRMTEVVMPEATTAQVFRVRGFRGTLGFIGGYSRSFCRQCNKIRITPQGMLKTCLYDDGVLDLKELLRSGVNDEVVESQIRQCLSHRQPNGFVAAALLHRGQQPCSMASIGG